MCKKEKKALDYERSLSSEKRLEQKKLVNYVSHVESKQSNNQKPNLPSLLMLSPEKIQDKVFQAPTASWTLGLEGEIQRKKCKVSINCLNVNFKPQK